MGGNKLQIRSIDIVEPVLIVGLIDTKNAEIGKKRKDSCSRYCACYSCCIMFLNSALEEIIRISFCKIRSLYRACKIAVKGANELTFTNIFVSKIL